MRDPILLQANNKDANQSVNRRSQIFVLFYFGSLRPSQHYSARSGRDFRVKTSTKQGLLCRAREHNAQTFIPSISSQPLC